MATIIHVLLVDWGDGTTGDIDAKGERVVGSTMIAETAPTVWIGGMVGAVECVCASRLRCVAWLASNERPVDSNKPSSGNSIVGS